MLLYPRCPPLPTALGLNQEVFVIGPINDVNNDNPSFSGGVHKSPLGVAP